jgi:hypothetical protein
MQGGAAATSASGHSVTAGAPYCMPFAFSKASSMVPTM